MPRHFSWTLTFATLAITQFTASRSGAAELTAMTYNLRYASPTGENAWPKRRPAAKALIDAEAPDVIGTQEGLYGQLRDLEADLPDYAWVGLGREGGSRGEFMAVFYRRSRLQPLEYDHYWLSDTPETIGSASWGNRVRRMVTWIRFVDLQTDREFYFINTHFDHESQPSREKSAALLLERARQLNARLPVILVGDFNSAAGANLVYDALVGEGRFADTWSTAQRRGEQIGTFHNYQGPQAGGARIDWILTRGEVACLETHVATASLSGQYPSDHFPVVARLDLP
ncbi:MAG: endonuclease/exonuclease/phosphatase family protein [Pirellulales bacterium]|nr:endonuclease/exonuclease/phosphatase family protein [Pirellulales bacterium]